MSSSHTATGAAGIMALQGREDVNRRLKVPAKFWDDHSDRSPCDAGSAGLCEEISRVGKSQVLIEGNAEQIETLRSDAAWYANPQSMDSESCPTSLIRSARATLAAIAKGTAS